jgi:signal transduction histidine kinase
VSAAQLHTDFQRFETNALGEKWFDSRIIAATRWLLGSTALIIIYLDPTQPDNEHWQLSYAFLSLFTLYSAILYYFSYKRINYIKLSESWLHWVDVAWFTLLTGLCTGTLRIFFFGFIFAILVASFRRGFAAGFSVVIVSTLSYTIISFTFEKGVGNYGFEVFQFLLRPVYLVVLGYLIAHWGGQELTHKRRLAFLKDITLSNPRFGVDRTVSALLERLRHFFAADEAILVTTDGRASGYLLYRADRDFQHSFKNPEPIAAHLADTLLDLPTRLAVRFTSRNNIRSLLFREYYAYDVIKGERVDEGQEKSAAFAASADASAFISVPVLRHEEITGRMYFIKRRGGSFETSDIDFLLQVNKHVNPVIENIRLVDRLASDAAEQERQRIARDIHDSVIQPYIGIQIGLSSLQRKVTAGETNVNTEINRLLEMTSMGIADLRQYIGGLKHTDRQGINLLSSINRFASKFSEATGIEVKIEAADGFNICDGLTAEVFQMIAEGLSNIRRHTEARHAVIGIACDGKKLALRIENDDPAQIEYAPFTPRSLTERAAALGGQTQVFKRPNGGAIVMIEIPL